jgi:SAM-dependent methyltransferase
VFLREATAKGADRVIGVDYSKEAHEAGAQWGVEMMTHETFREIPDHSVDVLRYSHVLEHLIDPKAVLHAQLRKLRPGGLLYVTHPNFPVFEVAPTTIPLHDSFFPNHLHFFNPLSCVALCGPNLVVEKLFSVSDELDAFERYRSIMDLRYASERLEPLRDRGEAVRGPLNGWPFYTGINIGLYARLSPAGASRSSDREHV